MISPKDIAQMRDYVGKTNKAGPNPLAEKKPAPSAPRGNKNQQKPTGWK